MASLEKMRMTIEDIRVNAFRRAFIQWWMDEGYFFDGDGI